MESGEISSEQITASSQYNSNWSPERSRLNYQENGWTPSDDTIREWIQVSDFSGGWRTNWSYVTLVLVWQSDLRSVGRRKARSPRFEPCRTSRDLARIWSEYCSLICTTFTLKKKQEITQHALFIETCLSSAVDIFFCLHCEIWRTAACDHWMWKDCSSTITLKNTLPVKRCRQVGSYVVFGPRATNCFQFRLRSHQARFIQWTLKPFFSYFVECIQAGNRFPGTPALRGPNISASIIWIIQQSFLLRCT